jgi:hypothetical protein
MSAAAPPPVPSPPRAKAAATTLRHASESAAAPNLPPDPAEASLDGPHASYEANLEANAHAPLPPVMPLQPLPIQPLHAAPDLHVAAPRSPPPPRAPEPSLPLVAPGGAAGGATTPTNLNDHDDDGQEARTDVYIRKTCPGGGEAHLIATPPGMAPELGREVWHLVPEAELELGHTVQCLSCKRVFLVARDQAESIDTLGSVPTIDEVVRLDHVHG